MVEVFSLDKSPGAAADWGFSWVSFLGADTIANSQWVVAGVDAALTVGDAAATDTTTSVILSGGTEGLLYRVKNTITTTAGHTWERTVYVEIVQK